MSKKRLCIATDTNCCFSKEEIEANELKVLSMEFLIDGKIYKEGIDLTHEEFYRFLENDVNVSTSQPTPFALQEFFDEILKEYEEVVYIPMSSGLSKACENAIIFAQDYNGKVQVVNNRRISVTQKASVMMAVKLKEQGKSASEIKKILEDDQYNSTIYITMETMKYLVKGGRCTPAAAAAGKLLKLKPILKIYGDKLDKYEIFNRTIVKAKLTMIEAMKNDFNTRFKEFYDNGEMELYIAHTNNAHQAEIFKEEVEQAFPGIKINVIDELSLVVSCHIGPGSLALGSARRIK